MKASEPIPTDLWAFEGRWAVSRQIADALGPDGRFEGEAAFTRVPEGLWYMERGVLRVGAAEMQAERRYLWRPAEAAVEGVEVWFDDGRFFHRFELGARATAAHDCPPDWYDVGYDFSGWPIWESRWRVTGPRKDYVMTSVYERAG